MNHHLDELEKVRNEMQDGYPDYDNRPAEDMQASDDAMFWAVVILCITLFMLAGFFAGRMSCAG